MNLHEMLVEDEIFLCGLTLLLGFVTGAIARFLVARREKEGGMNLLFAHHIEWQHVPVLLVLFAAGSYIGWELLGRCLARRQEASHQHQQPN